MKICTWNCLGPRYDKDEEIDLWKEKIKWLKKKYQAELYVIQECSKKQVDIARGNIWNYAAWYGDDIDWFMRGTAIFSDERYFTEREEFFHNPKFRYVVPYRIKNAKENLDFILYNVWTKAKPQNKEYEKDAYYFYENNVKEALAFYNATKHLEKSILIGDFNFGRDAKSVEESFGKFLEEYNFTIAEKISNEIVTYKATTNKEYFNDICFGRDLDISLLRKGTFEELSGKSDHIPLLFEVKNSK
ncbi:hypothetical protein [Treponema sp. UBA3813]|uniref:hypothetical protein n=1 Tax=Treponema sp. UBA3813 TaxID=1947715 RepID=UPI0025DCDBF8|nr:hypothetical protein [Treponema sp. UBA3813]